MAANTRQGRLRAVERRGKRIAQPDRGDTLPSKVDLDACPCVDGGHWWDRAHAIYHVKAKGALRGMAVRTLRCVTCDSTKDQPLTWDGRVAGHSVYDLTDTYIENARLLGDHFDRAPNMRKVALERARRDLASELAESA